MTVEELIERLAVEVADFEIDPFYLPDEHDDALLSYGIVSELRDWLIQRCARGDVAGTVPAFALIEDGFLRGDDSVRNLLVIELFEGIRWPAQGIALMGPKTQHERSIFGLIEDAEAGRVSPEQLDAVARALRRGRSLEPELDVRAALHVLAKARAKQHRTVVESHLADDDPRHAVEALRVLCLYWDETDRYADLIVDLLRNGVPPGREDVRKEAAFLAGRHLRGRRSAELLAALIGVVDDADENPGMRDAAYHAIGQALRAPRMYAGPGRPVTTAGQPPPAGERLRRARELLAAWRAG